MVVLLYIAGGVAALVGANMLLGRPVPFLRWSFLRMLFGMKHLLSEWQVGDGREEAAAGYVVAHAPAGSIDAAIALQEQHGFKPGSLDFAFIDHTKEAYLPDLQRILDAGWLPAGSVVVADNVGFPGAPEYKAYMDAEEGKRWRTRAHETHVEYQKLIADLVLESTLA